MGRARGTKRLASPAPGRWPPELRDLQRRGAMAPDWHDTWHGARSGLGEIGAPQKLQSPFFPEGFSVEDLGRRAITSSERKDVLSSMVVPEGEAPTRRDPVLSALLLSEWKRVENEEWASAYAESEDRERLFDIWEKEILGGLAWHSGGGMNPQPRRTHWWSDQERGRERLDQMPSSLLAAALSDPQGVDRRVFARLLEKRRSEDPSSYPLWVQDNIIPELPFLACRAPGQSRDTDPDEEYSRSLWTALQVVAGGARETNDLQAHHQKLLDILGPRAGFFASTPIAGSFASRGIYQEAWRNFPWHIPNPGAKELDAVARDVLVQQITRIYYGVDYNDFRAAEASSAKMTEWNAFAEGIQSEPPLQTLRDIFQGEGEEELFAELEAEIKEAASSHKFQKTVFLEDAWGENLSLDVALGDSFSRAIALSIRKYVASL